NKRIMNKRQRLSGLFFAGLLFSMILKSVSLQGQNLVNNGSFSATTAGWTFFAPATSVEAIHSEAIYGGISIQNIVAEIDLEVNLRQTNINVTPGESYYLSFRRSRRTNP